ncbi:MAG: HPF/RaiA family ribosome-associated protein [Endomicrobium sp.]|nr:HPF/RaiA family ribosome-associated protein [Endomicrobium sp.]
MQINITARHLRLTDAIDSYIRKKITKHEKLFNGDDVWAHVILSVEKNRQITEVVFHVGKQLQLFVYFFRQIISRVPIRRLR